MKKTIFYFSILLLLHIPAFAARNISLPFELKFDSMNYSDLLWVAGGGTHTFEASGGWSGGAAKFTPPNSAPGQTYTGLGSFNGLNTNQVNIRFLVKFGPTYESTARADGYGYQNKFVIVEPDSGNRGMTIFERYSSSPYYYTWGNCDDNTCLYDGGEWWPNGRDSFRSTDYADQWVCIELECNAANNATTVYIWTLDGQFAGEYMTGSLSAGNAFRAVQIIGGYFNGHHVSDPNNYIKFDELKIDSRYIGPPEGFLSGNPPPATEPPATEPPTTEPPATEPPTSGDVSGDGIIMSSNFETNNFSEWHGTYGNIAITDSAPLEGNYCARAVLTAGTHSDNYADYYFGDFYTVGGEKVEEIYLQLYSKFEAGYVWPINSHKIALLNLTNGQDSQRHYQVMINVSGQGEYFVEHSYIDNWQFFGLFQNQGAPVEVRDNQWDKLKLYVRLNTPGVANGIIMLWVNDTLKLSYSNVNIRENTSYGMNKLIMSSYATTESNSNGVQYYDNWILSKLNPVDDGNDSNPTTPPGVPPAVAIIP